MRIIIFLLLYVFSAIGMIATVYTISELKEKIKNIEETKRKEELKSIVLEVLDEILEDK